MRRISQNLHILNKNCLHCEITQEVSVTLYFMVTDPLIQQYFPQLGGISLVTIGNPSQSSIHRLSYHTVLCSQWQDMSLWETYRPRESFCQQNTVEELAQGEQFLSLMAWSEMTQASLSGPRLTASLWVPASLLVPLAQSAQLMEQISVRFPHLLTVQKCQREAALHPLPQPHPHPHLSSPHQPPEDLWQDGVAQCCRPSRLPESSNSLSGENTAGKKGGSWIDWKAWWGWINPLESLRLLFPGSPWWHQNRNVVWLNWNMWLTQHFPAPCSEKKKTDIEVNTRKPSFVKSWFRDEGWHDFCGPFLEKSF